MIRSVECLSFNPQSSRADQMLAAMAHAASQAGASVTQTSTFQGGSDLLCLWGPGAPNRFPAMRAQLDRGGHIACFDLAYWRRDSKVRVSIDAAHPQRWVMARNRPYNRAWDDQITPENRYDPNGPIIIAGLGDKARVQYGADVVDRWERETAEACAQKFGRPVTYRRKRSNAFVPGWADLTGDGPIDGVLAGTSLLVTWHSNVAVDAIRLGIPAICRDGAAAAVCPSDVNHPSAGVPLSDDLRWDFLAQLAWFQWLPSEAAQCFAFLVQELA